MFVVVCFDIVDDRRRRQVSRELENFGERVQYSVFECHLNEREQAELMRRLDRTIDKAEDKVHYYPLCPKDVERIDILGRGDVTLDPAYLII